MENTSDPTKNLFLDLKENGLNSGTFLATIKTGTTTTGGASSSVRVNSGTIKATQGGTTTVIYTDTTPAASTLTKTLALSSFDATLAFDAESYTVGSYAVVTCADAEENKNSTEIETLLDNAFIETSAFNRAKMRFIETGVDTGTFKGSIQVSSSATLDYERIQASEGETLTASCEDRINTTGSPRVASASSRVTGPGTPTPTVTPVITPTPTATVTPSTTFNIIQISGGEHQDYFLNSDSTVWGCGKNNLGQLGDGTKVDRNKPVQVSNLENITTLAVGWYSDLALESDGTVWVWGRSSYGYLKYGNAKITTTPKKAKSLKDVIALSSGKFYCLALKSDGTVWGWGRNRYGQLGDTVTGYTQTPVKIKGIDNVTAIIAGREYCMALLSDGTVWTWGRNTYGQLGDGTTRNRNKPVQVKDLSDIIAISGGAEHSLAVKSDGTVWAWGRNQVGQLGDGTNTDSAIPTQVKFSQNGVSDSDEVATFTITGKKDDR
ncbi:MAG: hypothetical protein HZB37_09900 [Planctomycetes bacterium]|nr:hypothetical protein [Planctomycetota bacterium]